MRVIQVGQPSPVGFGGTVVVHVPYALNLVGHILVPGRRHRTIIPTHVRKELRRRRCDNVKAATVQTVRELGTIA